MSESGKEKESLHTFFSHRSITVIGASQSKGKLEHAVLSNIIESGFSGTIYPISPEPKGILGLPYYSDLYALDGKIDLAVIVIPANSVPEVLESCGKCRVKAVIIISAGFCETGSVLFQ